MDKTSWCWKQLELILCPRSLFHFYIVSMACEYDKTFWTYSIRELNFFNGIRFGNTICPRSIVQFLSYFHENEQDFFDIRHVKNTCF